MPVNHSRTPKDMGLISAFRLRGVTPYYADIQFFNTVEEAKAYRTQHPGAFTLTFGHPLSSDANSMGVMIVKSSNTKRSRYVFYNLTEFNKAMAVYSEAVMSDPSAESPSVTSHPVSFVGPLSVISKSQIGSLGNYEYNDVRRKEKERMSGFPQTKQGAQYSISITDKPWCALDDVNSRSRAYEHFAAFLHKFQLWQILAISMVDANAAVTSTILADVSASLEHQSLTGLASSGSQLPDDVKANYANLVLTIKREMVAAAAPDLAKKAASGHEESVAAFDMRAKATRLQIGRHQIPRVPVAILLESATKAYQLPMTRQIVCDLSKMTNTRSAMSGGVIPVKSKIFAPGSTPDNIRKAICPPLEKRPLHATDFMTKEVRDAMCGVDVNGQDVYFFYFRPPPMVRLKEVNGTMKCLPMPTQEVASDSAQKKAIEYAPLVSGSVAVLAFSPTFSEVKGHLNMSLAYTGYVQVYHPAQLDDKYRLTQSEGNTWSAPADPDIYGHDLDLEATSASSELKKRESPDAGTGEPASKVAHTADTLGLYIPTGDESEWYGE